MNDEKPLIRISIYVFITAILFTSLFFKGHYNFFTDPVSGLGKLMNAAGLADYLRYFIFCLGCEISALFLLFAWRLNRKTTMLISGLGLAGMPIPADLLPLGHQMAAAMLVGGLFFFCIFYLIKTPGKRKYLVFLLGSVLIYAANHILSSPLKEEFQTPAVASIVFVLFNYSKPVNEGSYNRFSRSLSVFFNRPT